MRFSQESHRIPVQFACDSSQCYLRLFILYRKILVLILGAFGQVPILTEMLGIGTDTGISASLVKIVFINEACKPSLHVSAPATQDDSYFLYITSHHKSSPGISEHDCTFFNR